MSLDLTSAGFTSTATEFEYDWRTVVRYALGIGAKRDELDYLYEGKGPKVFPSFAVIPPMMAIGECLGKTQGNPAMIVHGSQVVRMHAPIPSEGTLKTVARIAGIYDMKKMAQCVITTETRLGDKLLFETEWGIIYRGEGGFGGDPPPKREVPEVPAGAEPSWIHTEATTPEQALLYRLSGDMNPLHADPDFAAMVGFPQGPILHGLCTYGFVARAVARHAAGGDSQRIKTYEAQFRKPVWPGEAITTKGWDLGGGRVAVMAYAADRPEPVITSAWAEIG
ncbi:MAG: MaoC family dehydratase N-terminal domain-containing protein [Polyangiaceae bacterium]|nr:MaoC family dehydratase N-terminal domain-containing protein [Polyangiaceae bacterium]